MHELPIRTELQEKCMSNIYEPDWTMKWMWIHVLKIRELAYYIYSWFQILAAAWQIMQVKIPISHMRSTFQQLYIIW